MKVDRAVAMSKAAVLFGGIVLILLALIVTEATSTTPPSSPIPSPSPFDEWARGRMP
jgi:hypothetical protein